MALATGRGALRLADPGDALVGRDPDDGRVLGAVGLVRDRRDPEVDDLDVGDLHG
jgi:hypothetical protein